MKKRFQVLGVLLAVAVPAVAVAVMEGLTEYSPGEVISAAGINSNFAALSAAVSKLQASSITDNREVDVADCAGLAATLAELGGQRILPGAGVTLVIQAGTHSGCAPVSLNHPDGARIALRGGGTANTDTVLEFDREAVSLSGGAVIGLVKNLSLLGNPTFNGVNVRLGGLVVLEDVLIRGFKDGVVAGVGGVLEGRQVVVEDSDARGFVAFEGGMMRLTSTQSNGGGVSGYQVHSGGRIILRGTAPAASASSNGYYGFEALSSGLIHGGGETASAIAGEGNSKGLTSIEVDVMSADGALIVD